MPAKTLKEFVAYAKANPGKLTFGSGGVGTPAHLAGELLKVKAGIDCTHAPFRGTGQALQSVIGGHVPTAFNPPSPLMPHLQSGTHQGDRRHHAAAHAGAAGRADHRRKRLSGLRRRDLARAGGAGRHCRRTWSRRCNTRDPRRA